MLRVTASDFIVGFAAIGDFLRRPPRMEALMAFKDSELVILVEGMEIGIPVSGHFEGMAWMSGMNTFGLAQLAKKRPPSADVMIDVSRGTIRVDSTIVPLRFESMQRPQMILVPKDAPLLFWLRLPHKFTQEEIAGAGLAVLVGKAIRTRTA